MSQSISQIVSHRLDNDQLSTEELSVILTQLQRVLEQSIDGQVVELGCYNGATSIAIARLIDGRKSLYLYDSFAGLPDKSAADASPVGEEFQAGELLASRKLVEQRFRQAGLARPRIKKAWFGDLTPSDMPEQIAFAFLDGDYYASIRDSLALVWPRLTPGAVIIVDDYANEKLPGAARAVDEWLATHPAQLRVQASLAILSR